MTRANKACKLARIAMLMSTVAVLAGCEPFALTSFGVGASTAVSHSLGGITYRTFTAPAPQVKSASIAALNRMGIKLVRTEKGAKGSGGEVLHATATDREIEITLESLSPNTTRMRVIARNGGVFFDSSTATEIIIQTERLLAKNGTKGAMV